ncbi:hypothetical protein IG631_22703 [Alternaria alternata]|nr:hypothetical protein IG631_22703 [Alternaria alternata]
MSFNNSYGDQFQGQPQGDMNNQTPQPGDMGQPMDASGNGFPPQGNMGPPGSAGGDGQGQGAGKTTLWRQVSPGFPHTTVITNDSSSRDERGPEFSIFVGDLGPEVTEFVLVQLFQNKYQSTKSAKIMSDPISGMSRGYGFVRFASEEDQQKALTEMQGVYCGNRPMRISTATPKNKSGGPGGPGGMGMPQGGGGPGMGMYSMGAPPMGGYYGAPQPMNQFTDPNNTTVFVGGLSGYVTEDELRSFFQGFGEITYVKIPPGKGCGFVQFVQRHAAEMAINQMQGYPIGNSRVRLSWGRSQNNSGPAGTPYRPAPPPPVPFGPGMGMPPQHPYGGGGGYGPMMKYSISAILCTSLTSLCSSFPAQAGQPSPYPPSMNTNLGGSRPSSQSAGPPTNPANGQTGNPSGQNGTPTFGNFGRFVSPPPNGANGSGFGSSDFGGAFSQQFPPQIMTDAWNRKHSRLKVEDFLVEGSAKGFERYVTNRRSASFK